MESEEDLVERVLDRLPTVQEAEVVLSKLEDELITVETINAGLCHEDLLGKDGVGFSELQCDVVLLSDESWESKYGAAVAAADADPYAWMAASLARFLPDKLQAPSKIWQDTMSALRAADVRSEAQLLGMTKAQLRSAKVPVAAIVHLQGGAAAPVQAETAQPDAGGSGGHGDPFPLPDSVSSAPHEGDSSEYLQYGKSGCLYLSTSSSSGGGGAKAMSHSLQQLLEEVERCAWRKDYVVASRVCKPKELFLRYVKRAPSKAPDTRERPLLTRHVPQPHVAAARGWLRLPCQSGEDQRQAGSARLAVLVGQERYGAGCQDFHGAGDRREQGRPDLLVQGVHAEGRRR
jgi:hypothetical protein